jgi:hypothetical protein
MHTSLQQLKKEIESIFVYDENPEHSGQVIKCEFQVIGVPGQKQAQFFVYRKRGDKMIPLLKECCPVERADWDGQELANNIKHTIYQAAFYAMENLENAFAEKYLVNPKKQDARRDVVFNSFIPIERVSGYKIKDGTGVWETEYKHKGKFESWGVDEGSSYAIIEIEGGAIVLVPAEQVKFVN